MSKKIVNTGKPQRKIDPKKVTKALGAEETGLKIDTKQSPISLLGQRHQAFKKMKDENS